MILLLITDTLTCHRLENSRQNILEIVLSETNSGKNPSDKVKESTSSQMDNLIMENGKIIKCMAMENFSILEIKSGIKANSKMVCLMDLVPNIPFNKYPNDKLKSIRLLLDFIKEVGSSMKEDLKMIKDKDLEKHSSKMEYG